VTFSPLGPEQLRGILDIELRRVQEQIFRLSGAQRFVFTVSDAAKAVLLDQGADVRYGARHLKRTISRLLMRPMSNLVCSGQIRPGDFILVDVNENGPDLRFTRRTERSRNAAAAPRSAAAAERRHAGFPAAAEFADCETP
jgi:ATP-dependent Clp protease ATP-binding subunit ClpA